MNAKTTCRVKGVIVPSDWTDSGEISMISVCTIDENEYRIELSRKGKELFKKINQQVEIEGRLEQLMDGPSVIHISNYRTMEGENEWWL